MPAGYSSQPVSGNQNEFYQKNLAGFTGHMPGAKWQVGRRYVPPTAEQRDLVHPESEHDPTHGYVHEVGAAYGSHSSSHQQPHEVHFSKPGMVDEGTQSEMSFRQDPIEHGVSYVNGITNGVHEARSQVTWGIDTGRESQAAILSPGSSNFSVGFDAQGRPVRTNHQQQPFNPIGGQPVHAHYHPNAGQYVSTQHQGIAVGEAHQRAPQTVYDHEGRPIEMFVPPSANQISHHQTLQTQHQITEFPSQSGHVSRADMSMSSGRSKSLPRRRIEKDPFEGVESGWWSKGEVLRNKERREMAEKGKSILGGDYNATKLDPSPPRKTWKERENELNDIPAAGYMGHIQGLRQIQVGKPFHRAAKEAKEQYVERRRALSGGREQFYSNGNTHYDGGSEHLNYTPSVVSGMHTRSAF